MVLHAMHQWMTGCLHLVKDFGDSFTHGVIVDMFQSLSQYSAIYPTRPLTERCQHLLIKSILFPFKKTTLFRNMCIIIIDGIELLCNKMIIYYYYY